MTEITKLRLYQARSHENAAFEFVSDMNAIVGPNGSGKTSILEALYVLLRGSSFKGSLSEITSYGTDSFQLALDLKDGKHTHSRSLRYQPSENGVQKQWTIDGKKYGRLPIISRMPVVLFEPDVARLITGGPERRRRYLDQIASQLDIEVASAQNRFERTLRQRNQLLKQLRNEFNAAVPEQLFIWNTQLAQYSEKIVSARLKLIEQLQNDISAHYRQLGGSDDIFLSYASAISDNPGVYASRLLEFLETSTKRDIALGFTAYGPHRDDMELRLADQPAQMRASRGEIRTIVIGLKLLETELLSKHFKGSSIGPVLLLDDVLSELDLAHQEQVLAGIKDHQVFITTTDAHALTPGVHTIALDAIDS